MAGFVVFIIYFKRKKKNTKKKEKTKTKHKIQKEFYSHYGSANFFL